ncbi:hypothetical protein ACP70R_009566 [Stipagrostis hirtigluma subsp. patula]
MHKEEVKTASHEVKDGSTMDEWDPWHPPCPPCQPIPRNLDINTCNILVSEWMDKKEEVIAKSRATSIIIPDRTPQWVNDAFYDTLPRLLPILEKDSTRCFLRLIRQGGRGLGWGFIITPQTFTQMIRQNALRCAKVVLEGKAPELCGFRANPNCMNAYGYFPLHQAAEMFSVDMIKLLFRYDASANVRTAGADVTRNLLPLHVAVENTCLHKYLEDNAFPNQEDLDCHQANVNYICKLIHLLCLPEMKIFLDTTRLLAGHTKSLVDELWHYIKDGKLVQTAILLLAAQKHIRMGPSCKKKNNSKPDGFAVIMNRIVSHIITLEWEAGQKSLLEEKKLARTALLLVQAVSQAGEELDAYIRSYPEVPHNMQVPHKEVLGRVSSILKDHGFCDTGEGINIGNLCRYEDVLSKEESPDQYGDMFAIKAAKGTPCQHAEVEKLKVLRNKTPRGWELKYARRSFFPYWRSVLADRMPVKVIRGTDKRSLEQLRHYRTESAHKESSSAHKESSSAHKESSPIPNANLGLLGRLQLGNHPYRRLLGGAASLLKVLKNA